jgi:hypothetical protein
MLTQKEIKQIEQFSNELKKWADNQSYNPPCATKVQLTPSWRYKKEILLLYTKTNIGAKVEKDFAELDQLHQEYESWRAKSITEDNEDKFRTLVDCLKGTLYNIADTFQQIAHISREELSFEMPAETEQDIIPPKRGRIWTWVKGFVKEAYRITMRSFFDSAMNK